MKPLPFSQPGLPGIGDSPPPSPTTALPSDTDRVHDALCVLQAPSSLSRIAELLQAAGVRTQRGTAFHPNETRHCLEQLQLAGQVQRDVLSRWYAEPDGPRPRFHALMAEPANATFWFQSWARQNHFDRYMIGFQDEAALAAALRIVIYGARSLQAFERLHAQARSHVHMWAGALHRAVLQPFMADLFEHLEPGLQITLTAMTLGPHAGLGVAELVPLEDWLLARAQAQPDRLPPPLIQHLGQVLLLRGRGAEGLALCRHLDTPETEALAAAVDIAQGRWEAGAGRFQAAWKALGVHAGRRKNLLAPTLAWVYPMALLARPEPAAWTTARKFVAAEAGKREAVVSTYWGLWQDAIDQRLGDAPKAVGHFGLTGATAPGTGVSTLVAVQRLLLAAWLRVEAPDPAALRQVGARIQHECTTCRLDWLALLARRALALLLREPPAGADADAPFFVGAVQDGWRDALASILALGAGGAAPTAGAAAAEPDRLIWIVETAADGRIRRVEPWEQKAGARGLGRPKPLPLSTLVKRKDLVNRDAAVLRSVSRDHWTQRMKLDPVAALPALVGHPHVAWASDPLHFIEVAEGLPALEVMTQGDQITFRLLDPLRDEAPDVATADDDDEDEEFDLDSLNPERHRQTLARRRNVLLLPDGVDRARLVRLTPAQLRVAELVSQGWKVPVSARAELDAALRVLTAHFQVASDADAGHAVDASSVLHAELTPQGAGLALRLVAVPFGEHGPRLAPGAGRERVTTVHQGVTLSTRRDLAAERAHLLALVGAVDFLDDGVHEWALDEPEQALALVEALGRLAPNISSEWPKGKPLRVRPVADAAVKLSGSSRGDWLELDGAVELDGQQVLRLRELLELMQGSRSRYVALGDGDFLALGDALRQQLADLAALAQPHKQASRLSNVAALAWGAHGGALALDGDAAWRQRSQAWEQAQAHSFEPPKGLATELRDYQLEGARWLMRMGASGFGAVLADDMGLGKTVQTLALLLQRAAGGPALVVAPTSVCGNWLAEAARFSPGLQVALYGDVLIGSADDDADAGAEADTEADTEGASDPDADGARASARRAARKRQVRALGPGQLLVCSYALLQIDAELLAEPRWHSVVLDEAQAIKNPATRRAKAALALQADFRLALTGTPIENRLGELWSIMGFCNPGLLGSAEQFATRFANPIERDADAQAGRRLRRLLSPFLLRRTKTEVLTDLPPRTEIVHEVVPAARERALLEALRQQAQESMAQALAQGQGAQVRFQVLAALTKLRRAACDPRLVAPELALVGAKVQEFERLAQELVAGRHKALVFSQFTDFLALLRERLDGAGLRYQYLDGSTPAAERTKRVAAFQAGEGDFFLISLKAGGFGLNLTVADYVIIADPWWNPASEDQASARAHRIGQQRPVTVYRLVTQGSIEEKIVRLHRSKRDLAEGILSGQDASAPVDAGALMALLRDE